MSSHPKNVLCVDDDVQSLDIRQQFLEAAGFHVITATSALEGLKLFRSRAIDAVILDYQMPDMNGGELAVLMKTIKPNIPVMIVSALPGLPEDAPKCIDAFVSKLEPSSALTDTIEHLVLDSKVV